ncbi:MAG TPA: AAA family ATPase [Anaeromyxobacteraceae bacterium]|nr:AAA family ATPase [Anaeromyxobacteraceae bacterium]
MAEAAPATPSREVPAFVRELDTLVRARYPLLYLVSWEEQRIDAILADLAKSHGKDLLSWSVTQGLRRVESARGPGAEGPKDPVEALQAIAKLSDPTLAVLKDFHPYLSDPAVVRSLRELAHDLKSTYTTVILLSPTLAIPPELEKEVSVLDVPLPTAKELLSLLKEIVTVVRKGNRAQVNLNVQEAEQLIQAALGLTLSEAENAFAKSIAHNGRLDKDDIQLVLDEKRQVIRKAGLLEYYPTDEKLANVGGLENLKAWLSRRAAAFGEPARKFGLPEPKGLLLLGVQGCGKSLSAKAIASTWRLPLLRLDMGRIFSGLVGSSEENLRRAIRVAEGVAPAVLWVDEIEKALSGVASSGQSDGGVTARVFGALLTWLQEKTAPVFVVATANRIDLLPPELLRKGRFDEIFFIDLPAAAERREIFQIHVARRGRRPEGYDLQRLAQLAEGYSGAEIEQAVVSALYDAFAEHGELAQAHLEKAVRESIPLAATMREEIARLREWSRTRTRPASSQTAEEVPRALAARFGPPMS